jgi:hypothetical protein
VDAISTTVVGDVDDYDGAHVGPMVGMRDTGIMVGDD